MPMIWTEAAVAKLFLGVLATSEVKLDYPALAMYMGPECTTEAIKQKMRKLKAAEKNAEAETGNKPTTASGTPATYRKTTKFNKAKGTGKRMIDEEIFDAEDSEETPCKPAKKRVKPAVDYVKESNNVKKENGAGSESEKTEHDDAVRLEDFLMERQLDHNCKEELN